MWDMLANEFEKVSIILSQDFIRTNIFAVRAGQDRFRWA